MTRALRELGFIRVTLRAHRDHRLAAVMGVAVETLRRRVALLRMAGLARERLCGVQRRRMDRVTADARNTRARRRMTDILAMAVHARARRIGVWLMTVGAARMREWREHRLIAMAGRAGFDLGNAELMRHVTTRALDVAGRDRGALIRMARGAARIGRAIGLVHVMAIETAARTCVFGLLIGVTLRARLGLEARRAMRVMTFAARHVVMRTDGMLGALRLVVTPHAVRRRDRFIRTEPVAVLTCGLMNAGVEWCHHAGVALGAELGGRRCEADLAVTCGARDLADVHGVTGADAHELIHGRHLLGNAFGPGVAADRDQQDQ
jgi:hypothetical protein